MSEVKPTPGPLKFDGQNGTPGHCLQAQVWDADGDCVAVIEPTEDPAVATSLARLFAEAGTVYSETGLTPRQLAEQRAELLEAMRNVEAAIAASIETRGRPYRDEYANNYDGFVDAAAAHGRLLMAQCLVRAAIAKAEGR